MKTLKTLTAVTFAGLFSMGANAGDFSSYDYEDYAQSSTWPTDSVNIQTSTPTVADIDRMIETSPTAAGRGSDISSLEYEDYVQSASWPTDSYRIGVRHTSFADVKSMIETSPTAAGASHVGGDALMYDLLGEDIHRQ